MNPILITDSYKVTHWKQYPPKTTKIYSYYESRGGLFPEVTFFGLQYILKKYFQTPVTLEHIEEAKELLLKHLGNPSLFNEDGWKHIINDHGGLFPLRIKAVPEGMTIPNSNVLMTVENTCPKCFWVTNYMETVLCQIWYPITVCTLSREIRKLILKYLEMTGDSSLIDYKLNDFGFRGVSSTESAGIGGCAHLVNFKGTDNIEALIVARDYYNESCAGNSIPATEHSTITSWGQENECEAFANMIKQYSNNPLYACVSDSFDIYRALKDYWGTELRDAVLNAKGTLVVRPDSGIPNEIDLDCLEILADKFGFSVNKKGYKVLNPKVRLIQGDGVDYFTIRKVLQTLENEGFSIDNISFGCGGALLQKLNRDTERFAFKCSAAQVDGSWREVFKCPITDNAKMSKRGKLSLIKKNDQYKTVQDADRPDDLLVEVYNNGVIVKNYNLEEIRVFAHAS